MKHALLLMFVTLTLIACTAPEPGAQCQDRPGCADAVSKGTDEQGCTIWECPSPGIVAECQNHPGCADAINMGTDEQGCIIWECPPPIVGGPCSYDSYEGMCNVIIADENLVTFTFSTDEEVASDWTTKEELTSQEYTITPADLQLTTPPSIGDWPCTVEIINKGTCTPMMFRFQ